MSEHDDTKGPMDDGPSQADLDREIEAALGGSSLMGVGQSASVPVAPIPTGDMPTSRLGDVEPGQARGFHEATVSGVGREDIFLEFGVREQGVLPAAHLATEPEVGSSLRVFIEGFDSREGLYICSLRGGGRVPTTGDLEIGQQVSGTIRAVNKGGFDVQCGIVSAFLPVSHLALEHIEDLEAHVGQKYEFEVIEVDPERRRVVVSRRGILGRQRDAARTEALGSLAVGDVVKGKVARIEPFGAFIDLGGIDGLLHVSQMAHKRVQDPKDHVSEGDTVEVKILEISEDGRRIGLSRKALEEDPFDRFLRQHPRGDQVEGQVTRLASYGAFIQLDEGLEGLCHVSQLAPGGVGHPKEIVKVGQTLTVRVAELDPERRRIGLSLLTDRGDRLTDDVADDATIREVLSGGDDAGEPTLGDLLKRALEGKSGDDQA